MKTLLLMLALIETPIAGFANVPENVNWAQAEVIREADDNPIIDKAINDYSLFYDIDPDLIRAVIRHESEGNTKAFHVNRNGTKDYGLMQINSCNHVWLEEEIGITDWYDPVQNIHAGTYILHELSQKYADYHQILMAYNMGPDRMKKLWRERIRSSEYSRSVMRIYNKLKEGRK